MRVASWPASVPAPAARRARPAARAARRAPRRACWASEALRVEEEEELDVHAGRGVAITALSAASSGLFVGAPGLVGTRGAALAERLADVAEVAASSAVDARATSGGLASASASSAWALPAVSPRTTGVGALLLLSLLFGSSGVMIKEAMEVMSPEAFCALRFVFSAACFSPLLRGGVDAFELRRGAELGMWLFAGYACQCEGLVTTDASTASFLLAFTVVTVPVLVGLSGGKVESKTGLAVMLSVLGIALLEANGTPMGAGDAWGLASAVLFGVHIWRSEAMAHSCDEASSCGMFTLVAVQLVVVALLSACWMVLSGADSLHALAAAAVAGTLPVGHIVYGGVVLSGATLFLEMYALQRVDSPTAAVLYSMEPLFGAFFAFALLGERWGVSGWVGMALIVAASSLSAADPDETPPRLPPATGKRPER